MAGDYQGRSAYMSLGPGEIRLLFAESISPDGIVWSLKPVRLVDESGVCSIEFDALSYTWGNQSHSLQLILADDRTVYVHDNLNAALPCLARRRGALPLWVDALCINQVDEMEKETQIGLMHKIYRYASHVVIWLGPSSTYTEEAVKMLPLIARVGKDLETAPQITHETLESRGLPEFTSPIWSSIYEIVDNSWFTRLWTIQEAALAKEIVCLCGDIEIDWSLVEEVVSEVGLYINKLHSNSAVKQVTDLPRHDTMFLIRDSLQEQILPSSKPVASKAYHLMRTAFFSGKSHHCSFARDRVLGILGLVEDDRIDALNLYDHDLPLAELYSKFCGFLLYNVRLATTLFWDFIGNATRPNKMAGLPSWCPDLHNQAPENPDFIFTPFDHARGKEGCIYHAGRPGIEWAQDDSNYKQLLLQGTVVEPISQVYGENPRVDLAKSKDFEKQLDAFNIILTWEKTIASEILGPIACELPRDDNSQPKSEQYTHVSLETYFMTLLGGLTETRHDEELTISALHEFRTGLGTFCTFGAKLRRIQEK